MTQPSQTARTFLYSVTCLTFIGLGGCAMWQKLVEDHIGGAVGIGILTFIFVVILLTLYESVNKQTAILARDVVDTQRDLQAANWTEAQWKQVCNDRNDRKGFECDTN